MKSYEDGLRQALKILTKRITSNTFNPAREAYRGLREDVRNTDRTMPRSFCIERKGWLRCLLFLRSLRPVVEA